MMDVLVTRRGCRMRVLPHQPTFGEPDPTVSLLEMRVPDGRRAEVILTNEERLDLAIMLLSHRP